MLFNAQEINQGPQLMADLHILFDMRWGMWQRFHALQKPIFTSLAIAKNHLATGGCWKQFGRNCLSRDTPLSIFSELQEWENRTANELILLSSCEVYSEICRFKCIVGAALETWLQSVISHQWSQNHQKFSSASKCKSNLVLKWACTAWCHTCERTSVLRDTRLQWSHWYFVFSGPWIGFKVRKEANLKTS